MAIAFDFHTLSLTIDYTLEEYARLTGLDAGEAAETLDRPNRGQGQKQRDRRDPAKQKIPLGKWMKDLNWIPSLPPDTEVEAKDLIRSLMGIHLAEDMFEDRSKFLRYRHEHAHFSSFVASGLADLHGIFFDYILAFLYSILRLRSGDHKSPVLLVPVIMTEDTDTAISSKTKEVIQSAWKHINQARAFFFGFGTNLRLSDLVDLRAQREFWEVFPEHRFSVIVERYYELISSLGTGVDLLSYSHALPSVEINNYKKTISSRAVMEAYAICIEIFNTHFRKVETNMTRYTGPLARAPGPLYTVAIEYALEQGGFVHSTDLKEFLAGDSAPEFYYTIAGLSFAAMQVPVLQILEGDVILKGRMTTLCPAHRFYLLVDAMREKRISLLSPMICKRRDDKALLDWLQSCNDAIQDPLSMAINRYVLQKQIEGNPQIQKMSRASQSLIELSWAARLNFMYAPSEYVFDAGLYSERFPCQVRYIRTGDAKIVTCGDNTRIMERIIREHLGPVFEAAVFEDQWDSVWAKMPEVPPDERIKRIAASFMVCSSIFKYENPKWPTVIFRLGGQAAEY